MKKELDIYLPGEEISEAEEKELFDIAVALQKAARLKTNTAKNTQIKQQKIQGVVD